MEIGKIAHKELKRFIERGDPSGLPPAAIDKITRIWCGFWTGWRARTSSKP